ncbi:MAG TPA: DUF192 domain-containing protein [Armatimonadetes bacterium]|jgi:uncharacterized membrane protein (UPF0127 family)|nr:DUF192 domain-containing protein [Armatimonadota bacterium]
MLARNCTRNVIIADDVCVARSWWSRFRGLMLVPMLAAGKGLLIERCRSIHTHFMRFPIDALFLDRDGVVLATVEGMRPWRIGRYYPRACAVLELPAGTIASTETRPGDRVCFEEAGGRVV